MPETKIEYLLDVLHTVVPGIVIRAQIDDDSYAITVPCDTVEQAQWLIVRLKEAYDRVILREALTAFLENGVKLACMATLH